MKIGKIAIVMIAILLCIVTMGITVELSIYFHYAPILRLLLRDPTEMIYRPYIPVPDEKVVVICFDDGWKTQLQIIPILDEYNYKATFCIITHYADQNPAYMNWGDVTWLALRGEDIESHSVTHKDLTVVSNSTLYYEVAHSKELFKENGIETPIFVYPFNKENETVRSVVAEYYLAARGEGGESVFNIYMGGGDARWAIPSFTMRNTTSFAGFCNIVDKAQGLDIVILVYHEIDTSRAYSIDKEQFTQEMAYLKANNFTIKTLSDLLLKENG